jgi:hypothetical protein
MIFDALSQELGHPTFSEIREYERNLSQHTAPSSLTKGMARPRYEDVPASFATV